MASAEYHLQQAENIRTAVSRINDALEDLIAARSYHEDATDLSAAIEYAGSALSSAMRDARRHKKCAAEASEAAQTPEVA